jgi:VanZ family protein
VLTEYTAYVRILFKFHGVLTLSLNSKSWRSSFYLLGALTVLCFIGGFISIDKDVPSEELDKRIDWLGAFLATAGLVLIVFVLSQGELAPQKWGTPCTMFSALLFRRLDLNGN